MGKRKTKTNISILDNIEKTNFIQEPVIELIQQVVESVVD